MRTAEEALKFALSQVGHNVKPRTCQLWTREVYGAPSVGDVDKDGASDAEDGWLSEPSWARHVGDRNPPDGFPVYFEGGSEDNGHRAISAPGNTIVGVDSPKTAKIGRVDLDWVERNWGLRYVGWSETISGLRIPRPNPHPAPKEPRPNTKLGIALANLRSARRRALNNGYAARVAELDASIDKLLKGFRKKR